MPPPKVQPKSVLHGNPFAVLAEPDVDRVLQEQQDKQAQRHAARGYTMPKLSVFGADVPTGVDPEPVFAKALGHGYRAFDTASAYDSIGALAGVSGDKGVSDELFVVYKIKPADDHALRVEARGKDAPERRQLMQRTVSAQLCQATTALGRQPDILMLHELGSDTQNEKTLKQLAGHVKAGQAKGLGLSNVNLADLKKLHQRAKQLGCPIKAVENRFSPYHHDDDIRRFCDANNIRYMGYGLMGSTQTGACVGEGHGSPTQYVLPRKDPRLNALADKCGVSTGELLIAWAYRENVVPVAFSTNDQRIGDNLGARDNPEITDEMLGAMDALFSPLPKSAVRDMQRSDKPSGLKELYGAFPDPTMWFILDTVCADADVEALLNTTAREIGTAADLGSKDADLKNFALNLMRHVGDFQSAGLDEWPDVITRQLADVAQASDRPEVSRRFSDWATKNASVGGDFVNATAAFVNMLAPPPAATRELDTAQGWSVFTSGDYDEPVADPEVGQTYHFYHNGHDGPEMFSAQVDALDGSKLTVTRD